MAQANAVSTISDNVGKTVDLRAFDKEFFEMLDDWMLLSPDEREAFIQQVRDEVPGASKIADAFERHHRSLLARAA